MTRRPTLLLAMLVMVAALLPSAGAAASSTSFQGFGCFGSPTGDVADPRADLVEVCIRYFPDNPSAVVVSMEAVAPFDPLGDPVWLNAESGVRVGFSTDGDDQIDRVFTITREGDALVPQMTDADGAELDGCGEIAQVAAGRFLRGQFNATCIDDATAIRTTTVVTIQPEEDGSVAMDQVPAEGMTVPIPRRDEPPVCANAIVDATPDLTVTRLACGGVITGTEPISQAVATSQFVFDNPATPVIDPYRAEWVVLARDDDFADALAGSSLSFGQGPLLFTYSPVSAPAGRDPGQLADITRAEILRSLPRGRTVYLLGGEAALHPGIDAQLTDLGYEVVRFAGTGREQTARFIAQEVRRVVETFEQDTGFVDTNMVLVVRRDDWPDAVIAGSLGAFWGMPILLADLNPPVHPDTLAALDELRPDYIHIVGGGSVVSSETFLAIMDHAIANGYGMGRPGADLTQDPWQAFCSFALPDRGEDSRPRFMCRWSGPERVLTGAAVGQFNRDMVQRFRGIQPFIPDNPQQYAVAVNLGGDRNSRNFAYVLAAATVSGRFGGAIFVPTTDQQLTEGIRSTLCSTPGAERFVEQVEQFVVVGDTDLLSGDFVQAFRDLARPGGCT